MQLMKNLKLKVQKSIKKICKFFKSKKPVLRDVIESVDIDEGKVTMLVGVDEPEFETLGLEILFEEKKITKCLLTRRCKSHEALSSKNVDMRCSYLVLA